MSDRWGSVSLNFTHSYQRNSLPIERGELGACYVSAFGESIKQSTAVSLQSPVVCNTEMRQFIKRNKIQY